MPKREFDKDGFPLDPNNIDDHGWFYEGRKGLTVAYQAKGTLQSITGIVELPWRKLLPAFERYQKYQRRKKRASKRGG